MKIWNVFLVNYMADKTDNSYQKVCNGSIGESRIVRLNKVSYLCIVNLNIQIMI